MCIAQSKFKLIELKAKQNRKVAQKPKKLTKIPESRILSTLYNEVIFLLIILLYNEFIKGFNVGMLDN